MEEDDRHSVRGTERKRERERQKVRANSYRLSRASGGLAQKELVPSVETALPFLPPCRLSSPPPPSRVPLSLGRAHAFVAPCSPPRPPRRRPRALPSRSVQRTASPFRAPVPFDDLSLPPALFSSLSPDTSGSTLPSLNYLL